ncbi:hypothetical protein EJV46_11650 [Roseococcus sp. SYP-B2431]|uniref:hypothetical protein n=1 Tax=Roseococcus sp. SYP-B2431 TaxID=2496640 RepID=UPI00103FC2E6|nr:hypothetical protein [Roseococcus sp. SYP-B2431]TCH97873.1 hypothetical protein EJV46_11650 [Roseococcus sp. SYP-B2431]
MSSISLNMDGLFYGLAIAVFVALLGTPAAWRLLGTLPHAGRALATYLCCIGLSGLLAIPFAFAGHRLEETVLFAVMFSAAFQLVTVLIPLLFFSPKRP